MAFVHHHCLSMWIHTSRSNQCELCLTNYTIIPYVLETTHRLNEVQLQIIGRPYAIYLLWAITIFAALFLAKTHSHSVWRISDTVEYLMILGDITPYLLIVLAGIQGIVLVPAIAAIRNKRRYLRYVFCTPSSMRVRPIVPLGALLGGFCMSFRFPLVGATLVIGIYTKLYDLHEKIVRQINTDVLREYSTGFM